ncbi:MAG: ATP-binding cassette domain-containing protein [Methylophaga sp.]|nr:ATP-binding cassette domain-containing protein [Methylophaga sp.]
MKSSSQRTKQQGKLKLSSIKAVWSLLPDKKKPEAISLLLLMIVGMMLEMLGVGLVLPLIVILTDNELTEKYPFIASLLDKLGNPDQLALLMGVMLVLVAVYSVKNLYLALLAWKQSKFVFDTQTDLAVILFRRYLYHPYSFHLQRNSAELINNLQVELSLFVSYMLSPGMLLIAETMVVLGLVGLLLFFEPVGAITVFGVFILVGGLFQWLTKKRITAWGKQRQQHESQRMKHAQQGLGAVKDVKLYGKEEFFLAQYADHTEMSLKMNQRNSFMHNVTRLWLEILAISGLSLLFAGMMFQGKLISEILPVLGLFAAVSFRLMPSINRIIGAIHQLRFGSAVTDFMQKEFNATASPVIEQDKSSFIFDREILLHNIFFKYQLSDKYALKKVNITIKKGEMIGFVGESGSGKSTLIDIILGLLTPQQGHVQVDDLDILENMRAWQNLIGYVPQSIYLTDDTLRRNIAFGFDNEEIDESAIKRTIVVAQLENLVSELPDGLDTMLGERGVRLSGGQKQRIGIARALYNDPDILVLDEATSALDNEIESDVMEAVINLQGEKTILIIAHRLTTLEKCDFIYRLEQGEIVAEGVSAEVLVIK